MRRLKLRCKKCKNKLTSLKPGDIILYNNVNTRLSKIVSWLTNTRFIHAGIYIGGKGIHELIWDKKGYRRYPVFRTINHFCRETKVLRLSEKYGKINVAALKKISKQYEGQQYGLRTIFKILFHRVWNIRIFKKSKYKVCSVMVAQIYKDIDIDLFPHIEITEVIPSDFIYCEKLYEVDL